MNEDIELDKLRILLNAVEAMEDEEPDFYAVLKEAAWNVLHENPGFGFDEWVQTLMGQYPPKWLTLSAHTLRRRMLHSLICGRPRTTRTSRPASATHSKTGQNTLPPTVQLNSMTSSRRQEPI